MKVLIHFAPLLKINQRPYFSKFKSSKIMLSKYIIDAKYCLANDNSDSGPHDNLGERWWLKVKTGQQ